MVNLSLWSLSDICGIHIAYLMWARRYVAKNSTKETLFKELEAVVVVDVERLCLKDEEKDVILGHVEPTGKHLLSLLSLWIFAQPENSQQWLTGDILFECLVLNAHGLINQRKTAEKILSSRVFDNVFAFRLASINFLENEVLKLWIFVKEYFLNKLFLEGLQANSLIRRNSSESDSYSHKEYSFDLRKYTYESLEDFKCPRTTEREEVLFWVSYCLSKEKGISIRTIPHFLGSHYDWFTFSLEFAALSGNIACFEYFRNSSNTITDYNCVDVIQKLFYPNNRRRIQHPCFYRQLPCFVFHYALLNCDERAGLFQKSPSYMLFYFLHWPLSQTFLKNLEKLRNFVEQCIEIGDPELFKKNVLRLPEIYSPFGLPSFDIITGIYSTRDLIQIWVALWNISSLFSRSIFLDFYIFNRIWRSRLQQKFIDNFVFSGLKEKLFQLFLSNGEAILKFFKEDKLKKSLRNIVSEYMTEHYEDLDSKCISFLADRAKLPKRSNKLTSIKKTNEKKSTGPFHKLFLNYLKEYAFSQYRN